MLSTHSLLELYKAEKADFADYATEFPKFSEWKKSYEVDFSSIERRIVSCEEADSYFDSIVEIEEKEMPLLVVNTPKPEEDISVDSNTTDETAKEITMYTNDETTVTTASTETTEVATPAKAKRVRKPSAGKKVAATKAPKVTKADKARSIFKRLSRGKTLNREKILEAFQKEAGLSKNGAATYYQSLRKLHNKVA